MHTYEQTHVCNGTVSSTTTTTSTLLLPPLPPHITPHHTTPGIIHVFSTLWFDSGYMSLSGYEASGRIYSFFYVNVNLDPEVDSRRDNLDIISTSSIWQFLRQLQRLLEESRCFSM